jgi:phage regulator Rha-like protein
MNKLVILKNDIPLTTSVVIAFYTDVKHESIFRMVKKYENDLNEFGVIGFEIEKPKKGSKGGQPKKYAYLNEEQTSLLIMYLKNTEKIRMFKKLINKQFYQMKIWILEQKTQKQNQQYIETRNQSKIGRKQQTDVIKIFIEYAKKQGSKSADKYYMIFSKMENSSFFILKERFKNVRAILNIQQLSKIIVADMIIKQAIIEGMEKEMFYKDIFKEAKKRVLRMSNSVGFKEILPNIWAKQITFNELVEKKNDK